MAVVSSTRSIVMDATQASYMSEECILVNQNDEPVGKARKEDCHKWPLIASGGGLHRAFSVFLFNSSQQLLLQRRAASKITFPGVWSNTCCSHPLFRPEEMETNDAIGVRRAAKRKLIHELGFTHEQISVESMDYVTRFRYSAPSDEHWGEHEIDYALVMFSDAQPRPNPNEIDDWRYVSSAQLRQMIDKSASESGVVFSPWFLPIAERFLFKWWEDLANINAFKDHKNIHVLN